MKKEEADSFLLLHLMGVLVSFNSKFLSGTTDNVGFVL